MLNAVLGIVVDPKRSSQLGFCAQEVFNQIGERRPILKEYETHKRLNILAMDQKAEWSHSEVYGASYGDTIDLLI